VRRMAVEAVLRRVVHVVIGKSFALNVWVVPCDIVSNRSWPLGASLTELSGLIDISRAVVSRSTPPLAVPPSSSPGSRSWRSSRRWHSVPPVNLKLPAVMSATEMSWPTATGKPCSSASRRAAARRCERPRSCWRAVTRVAIAEVGDREGVRLILIGGGYRVRRAGRSVVDARHVIVIVWALAADSRSTPPLACRPVSFTWKVKLVGGRAVGGLLEREQARGDVAQRMRSPALTMAASVPQRAAGWQRRDPDGQEAVSRNVPRIITERKLPAWKTNARVLHRANGVVGANRGVMDTVPKRKFHRGRGARIDAGVGRAAAVLHLEGEAGA